jgi:hypothetical protein
MICGDHPDRGPLVGYADALPTSPPTIQGLLLKAQRQPQRGLAERDRHLQVFLEANNLDQNQPASQVVLTDRVPDGYEYVWASAACPDRTVSVDGANPYRFSIGDLAPSETVLLSYLIVRRESC